LRVLAGSCVLRGEDAPGFASVTLQIEVCGVCTVCTPVKPAPAGGFKATPLQTLQTCKPAPVLVCTPARTVCLYPSEHDTLPAAFKAVARSRSLAPFV
jgi:hypothetical protein